MDARLIARYLLHRLTSKNRHGLHSPFVYKLLDEVIYDHRLKTAYNELKNATKNLHGGGKPGSTRVNQLLYRLLQYFDLPVLAVANNVGPVTRAYIQNAVPNAKFHAFPLTAINLTKNLTTCQVLDTANITAPIPTKDLPPEGMFIITNIYANNAAKTLWNELKTQPNITVTIDLFFIGLAFNRPGQVKEHFKLRF